MTEANIASNEKLFGDYMKWQRKDSRRNSAIQRSSLKIWRKSAKDQRKATRRAQDIQKEALGYQKEMMDAQRDMMDWQKGIVEKQEGRADEYFELMKPQIEGQTELADATRRRYLDQGMPFENQYLDKITGWDTATRRGSRAAEAAADVSAAMEASRESNLRRLESYGIDPSQTRSAALDTRAGVQGAVAKASAMTKGRRDVEREGISLGGEAVNLYRGLPAASAQALATGAQVGTGALGAGLGALEGGLQAARTQAGMMQTGVQGYANLANMENQNRQASLQTMQMAGQQFTNAGRNNLAGWQTGGNILGNSQNMAASGYGTANAIYGNELAQYEMDLANSPMNIAAGVIGTALPLFFEEGGYVDPDMSPSGGAVPDDVPARVSAGEVVLPEDTVRYHGLKTINKLNAEAGEKMALPNPGYTTGPGGRRMVNTSMLMSPEQQAAPQRGAYNAGAIPMPDPRIDPRARATPSSPMR